MPIAETVSCGTLVLGILTPHGAYLTADSRATNPPVDTAQKLFKCGPNAFMALTGNLVSRPARLSAEGRTVYSGMLSIMEVLRHFCFAYSGDGRDLPERISALLYRILKPWWDLFITGSPGAFMESRKGDTTFCEIPILTRIGGKTALPVVRFPFSPDGDLLVPTKQTFFENCPSDHEEIRTFGQSINGEAAALTLDSQEDVLSSVAILYRQAASAHPDTVGGPVDIGFIDTNGGRWLARKRVLD